MISKTMVMGTKPHKKLIKFRLVNPLIEDYIQFQFQRKSKMLFLPISGYWDHHIDIKRTCLHLTFMSCFFVTLSPHWELKMIIPQLRISSKEMSKILVFVVFKIYFNWNHHLDKKKACLHLTCMYFSSECSYQKMSSPYE